MTEEQIQQQRKIRKHLHSLLKKQAIHHRKVVADLQKKLQESEWKLEDLRDSYCY